MNSNINLIKLLSFIISLLVFTFFIFHAKNIKLDASSDTLILQNDETFKYFNFYNEIFPSKNFLILAVKSNKNIDIKYIDNIKAIKNKLSKIEGIESVISIIDLPILITNNKNLSDLANYEIETLQNTELNFELIIDEFSKSPVFKDQIINSDKNISSIIIYLKKDEHFLNLKKIKNNIKKNNYEYKNLISKYKIAKKEFNQNRHKIINNIRNNIKNDNNSYIYFLGGIDMIADDTLRFIKNDIITFSISVFIFIFILLFLIFRSIKWVFIPLITTTYAIICMLGLMSFLGWEITAISSNFISLMLILSISMSIHIINNYRLNYNKQNIDNIKKTLNRMFWPCFYTALTTIVAFSSLLFSDIKPVIDFGKIMIMALIIILITSFSILPLLISFFPKIKEGKNYKFNILLNLFNISRNHKIKIYLINIIFFLISIFGISKLNVENSFINYFKSDTEIYQGMKLIDEELGGTTPIDIIIEFEKININNDNNELNNEINSEDELEMDIELSDDLFIDENQSSDFFTDENIATIRSIHEYLENRSEIGKVQSIYSLIQVAEQINKKSLTPFELSIIYNEIPENYKQDLIYPYLSLDNNMIKISGRVKDSKNIKRANLISEIEEYISKNYENISSFKINGLLVLYNNMLQSLFSSQIKSFGIVLISIFIMFLLLFRSFKISFVGIIPNIFASTFILGFIGLANIPLDIMTITIAAITIGIAVDNTIHYLYKAKNNIGKKMTLYDSLKDSHNTVGQAILTTSLTIAFGFSVLCMSNFIPTILFGIFTAIAMIIAMLGVLITLPAGLMKVKL